MSILDKVIAAVVPEPTPEKRAEVRRKARAASDGSGWLAQVLDHHEQIEAAFEAVRAASNGNARRSAERELAVLLTGHSLAEETVLYPAMALGDHKAHSAEAYTEQSGAKVQLAGLEDLDPQLTPEAMLAQAVEANVRWTMRQILESPEGRERQIEGRLKLVGAIDEIETGLVRFLE